MASIFLSHSSRNKRFSRRLAEDLKLRSIKVWLDEAELKIGDSLIYKIQEGIEEIDYLGVILSPQSVESEWVKREVEIALNDEITGQKVKVLPILWQPCQIPSFLRGKVYADLSTPKKYKTNLHRLIAKILGDELGLPSIEDEKNIDEDFAQAYVQGFKESGFGIRSHQYVFFAIAKGRVNFDHISKLNRTLRIHYRVRKEVLGVQDMEYNGIDVSLDKATVLFARGEDKLGLSPTGFIVLKLLSNWLLNNPRYQGFDFETWD